MNQKRLIVNADDFGQSPGVNGGVKQAHEQGILTSASLMVRWPAAAAAAEYASRHPRLSVGLHIDLGEWAYRDGLWIRLYQVVDETDARAVAQELENQTRAFEKLMKRAPTHLDSHQHVHRKNPVREIVAAAGQRLGIPVREESVHFFCGRFYGQDDAGISRPEWIGVEALLKILAELKSGVTEISCHPAAAVDLETMYRQERLLEVATLCNPSVQRAVAENGIELISFHQWASGD